MNSIHRIGLTIAGLVTGTAIAAAFVADGYISAHQTAAAVAAATAGQSATADATGTLGPETVYVRPAPSPSVIQVTQTATPGAQPVIHVIVPGGGEPEDNESGDD